LLRGHTKVRHADRQTDRQTGSSILMCYDGFCHMLLLIDDVALLLQDLRGIGRESYLFYVVFYEEFCVICCEDRSTKQSFICDL
jgi:hypothetical protein